MRRNPSSSWSLHASIDLAPARTRLHPTRVRGGNPGLHHLSWAPPPALRLVDTAALAGSEQGLWICLSRRAGQCAALSRHYVYFLGALLHSSDISDRIFFTRRNNWLRPLRPHTANASHHIRHEWAASSIGHKSLVKGRGLRVYLHTRSKNKPKHKVHWQT